jgi:FkbM family methyltransferase
MVLVRFVYNSPMFYKPSELAGYWGVKPKRILHVGAHDGEEAGAYREMGWTSITWVEANPEKVLSLKRNPATSNDEVFHAAIWDIPGLSLHLNIASNSESSSLFSFGTHTARYPEIQNVSKINVITTTLDLLMAEELPIDFINLDIQGAELRALRGFTEGLKNVKWIYTEVNSQHLYQGCSLVDEIDDFLQPYGFLRKTTRWWMNDGWGDALYINVRLTSVKRRNLKVTFRIFSSQIAWNILRLLRIIKKMFMQFPFKISE